jgi:opacity protein-like surface antigen
MRTASRLLASLAMLAPASALAADYEPPLVIEQEEVYEEAVPVEIGSGWYLRGDIGYSLARSTTGPFTFRSFDVGTASYTSTTMNPARYGGGINAGIGFGYRFTDWFRSDLTLERFDLPASGTAALGTPCAGQAAGTTCNANFSSVLSAYSLMANAYVDLGTFARFTPYVGLGAGLVRASWLTGTVDYNCVPGVAACAAGNPQAQLDGLTSYRFSYAAMAGVAFDINKNFKLDLGYKFRAVGGGNSHNFSAADQAAGATGAQVTAPGFMSHEIRLGLRYELW